jgi:hypothetical protein
MPSLFSRARTTSTKGNKDAGSPTKNAAANASSPGLAFDEFGRVVSRDGAGGSGRATKGSKGAGSHPVRPDSALADAGGAASTYLSGIPDGSFLPLQLDPPRYDFPDPDAQTRDQARAHERGQTQDYGYLSYKRHVVLAPEQCATLVDVLAEELSARGLTTPFLFSSMALGVSASGIRRLIEAYLDWCRAPTGASEARWREEARFAAPSELAMCLRWGLARVVRVYNGQEVRGLLEYRDYADWRDVEAGEHAPVHPVSPPR